MKAPVKGRQTWAAVQGRDDLSPEEAKQPGNHPLAIQKELPFGAADPRRAAEVIPPVDLADHGAPTHILLAALAEACQGGFIGHGGRCGYAALAINHELFAGKGTLIAAYNKPMLDRLGDFVGHVAVRHEGRIWDATGVLDPDDFEAWGMLDPEDLDYAERYGDDWDEGAALDAATMVVEESWVTSYFPDEFLRLSARSVLHSTLAKQGLARGRIEFQEFPLDKYPPRTKANAEGADATIAIAVDFSTAGERLTKRLVLEARKPYCHVAYHQMDDEAVGRIVNALNTLGMPHIRLNIAGNGLSRFKGQTQEQVDEAVLGLLARVVGHPGLRCKVVSIRSGGQTGVDEAGVKAARGLGIDALVLAPKGWLFRPADGRDVADEASFKARFHT